MSDKIRVSCNACEKRLAVPAAAAGRKIRCPGCGDSLRVPTRNPSSGNSKTSRRRQKPREDAFEDYGGDPYAAPPAQLPGRTKSKKRGSKKNSRANSGDTEPGSKKIRLGASIFFGAVVVSAGRLAFFGHKTPVTAEEKGAAFGAAFAVLIGIVTGVTMMVLGMLANRKTKRG